MNVIFHEYFKTNREREFLGCPHIWLGEAYQAPMRYCFREMEKRGIHAYLSTELPPEKADLFIFWERPREGDPACLFPAAAPFGGRAFC